MVFQGFFQGNIPLVKLLNHLPLSFRYWLIQTKDIKATLNNIRQYEEEASIIQYNAQFIVYARMLSERTGELRICLITDDYAAKENMFNANEGE